LRDIEWRKHFVASDLFPRKFSRVISKLKRLREDADYGDYLSISEDEARQEINNAEEFVRTADEVLSKLLMGK
jgi:uncharacterized protein (UPF0332 family)